MLGTVAKRPDLLLLYVQLPTTLPLHHVSLHHLQELTHLHNSRLVAMLLGALLNTVTETLFWRCSAAFVRTGWKLCTLWQWTLDRCNHNKLALVNGGSHMPTTPSSVKKQQPGVH